MGHGYPQLGDDEKPTAEEDVVYSDKRDETPDLRILHYDDIYHPEYEAKLGRIPEDRSLTSLVVLNLQNQLEARDVSKH
jgi:hypothetical protein